jgi:hypothetical protein
VKRALATVALLAALVVGIVVMADATQNRPDVRPAGSMTTVDFTVSSRDYQRGDTAAATALWAVCSATIGGTVSPAPEPVGDTWRVTISPQVGDHGRSRLVGCLEDVTLDRVLGNVVSFRSTR